MSRPPIQLRLWELVQRFDSWTIANGAADQWITRTGTTGMTPRHEEDLTGDLNRLLNVMDGLEDFPNIQQIAVDTWDYQGGAIAVDWEAIRTPVNAARDRIAAGGATRWDSYSHTVVNGRGVLSTGTRTDAILAGQLTSIKSAIQAFLANIPS